MPKLVALLVALIVGGLTSAQASINAELGKHIGGLSAAVVSFVVGALALLTFYIFSSEKGLQGLFKVPTYLLLGGFLGAILVYGIIKIVPFIGVSAATAGVIAGQLLVGMIIDHFGLFGGSRYPINATKLVAAVMLIFGANLMARQ